MATLTYVYNHHERELASRLTQVQHEHHDLTMSTTHVHLDHDNCMETAVLRGTVEQVEDLANAIISQPGVRHGQLYLLPVQVEQHRHAHGHHSHSHTHIKPLT
ncbi:unnamed protein product [Cyprideis torosa]|uniref:Uncharacterized protein n=1 Tax=Cyprideis torosa TaxID=163714 RepID=A0A7R8WUT2_9CRUS|nr:unnamed protein product [Cyprideis torosa]CAG0910825.1 unnamed protein product [Cyprideis torosa]